jgi:hypothetical protein
MTRILLLISSTKPNPLGQMPGFPFIANYKAPRAPGSADAAVANLHHPDAEAIGPGLHVVLPPVVAGGVAGFEDGAEVEHGAAKKTFLFCRSASGYH